MLPDFEMIQHQFLGGHDITVIPISDVHLGSPECMEQEFIQFVSKVKEAENVYLILGGDLIENGTRSSVGSSVFRQKMSPSEQKREMANILEPIRDRLLCVLPGNHERRSGRDSDDDPCYDIAVKLDCEHLYRENIAFIKIRLGKEDYKTCQISGPLRPTYVLTVVHGSGGGMLTGGAVNRAERFGYVIDGADALILGHTHRPYITQPGKIYIDRQNNKVSIKPFKVISATSWLEYGGYAAQKMLTPTTHCLNKLILKGDKKEIIVTM